MAVTIIMQDAGPRVMGSRLVSLLSPAVAQEAVLIGGLLDPEGCAVYV